MIRKAIIPVAGKGTRMAPITNIMAKEMLPIGTTPTLEYVVREAVASGIEQILFVLSTTKGMVAKYFAGTETPITYEKGGSYEFNCLGKDVSVCFTYQGNKVGSGGAVLYGRDFANGEGVAVLFGDDIIIGDVPATKQLIDLSDKMGGVSVLGVQHQPERILRQVGVIDIKQAYDGYGTIAGLVEKPTGALRSDLASLGRFVLSPDFFAVLAKTPQRKGEIWLTEAFDRQSKFTDVYYCDFKGTRYDIGNKYGYIHAFSTLAVPMDEEEKKNYDNYIRDFNKED